jgi:hypothetical protein
MPVGSLGQWELANDTVPALNHFIYGSSMIEDNSARGAPRPNDGVRRVHHLKPGQVAWVHPDALMRGPDDSLWVSNLSPVYEHERWAARLRLPSFLPGVRIQVLADGSVEANVSRHHPWRPVDSGALFDTRRVARLTVGRLFRQTSPAGPAGPGD